MSTWTSRATLLAACVLLSACGGGGAFVSEGSGDSAPRDIAVTSDRIVVAGPEGFCVDPDSTRDQGDTAFVVLGNCAVIANSRRAPQPAVPALLTAAISAQGLGGEIGRNLGALDAFFRSVEGRRLVSRTQEAATVEILDTAIEGDVFFLHARDTSEGPVDGVQRDYWRAYLDLGDRLATLSVLGLQDRELTEAQSRTTLRQFLQTVRAANDGSEAAEARAVAPAAQPPAAQTRQPLIGPLWNVGLFRRIFG